MDTFGRIIARVAIATQIPSHHTSMYNLCVHANHARMATTHIYSISVHHIFEANALEFAQKCLPFVFYLFDIKLFPQVSMFAFVTIANTHTHHTHTHAATQTKRCWFLMELRWIQHVTMHRRWCKRITTCGFLKSLAKNDIHNFFLFLLCDNAAAAKKNCHYNQC